MPGNCKLHPPSNAARTVADGQEALLLQRVGRPTLGGTAKVSLLNPALQLMRLLALHLLAPAPHSSSQVLQVPSPFLKGPLLMGRASGHVQRVPTVSAEICSSVQGMTFLAAAYHNTGGEDQAMKELRASDLGRKLGADHVHGWRAVYP